jgi:hypothetical protein
MRKRKMRGEKRIDSRELTQLRDLAAFCLCWRARRIADEVLNRAIGDLTERRMTRKEVSELRKALP